VRKSGTLGTPSKLFRRIAMIAPETPSDGSQLANRLDDRTRILALAVTVALVGKGFLVLLKLLAN
jgi:hypothetical protein